MRCVNLTAQQLSRWLAERGIELGESFWQRLLLSGGNQPVFEHQFLINQVPWRGAVRLSVSLVQYSRLRMSGWCVSSSSSQSFSDDEIFVMGLAMEALVFYPRRLQRPLSWLTPYVHQPEYGIQIEYPTIEDLDAAWQTLSSFVPHVYSVAETMTLEFEETMGSGHFPMAALNG